MEAFHVGGGGGFSFSDTSRGRQCYRQCLQVKLLRLELQFPIIFLSDSSINMFVD